MRVAVALIGIVYGVGLLCAWTWIIVMWLRLSDEQRARLWP